MNAKSVAMLKSYSRAWLATGLTLLLADLVSGASLDPIAYMISILVAALPVVIRWLDPTDAGYGRTKITKAE